MDSGPWSFLDKERYICLQLSHDNDSTEAPNLVESLKAANIWTARRLEGQVNIGLFARRVPRETYSDDEGLARPTRRQLFPTRRPATPDQMQRTLTGGQNPEQTRRNVAHQGQGQEQEQDWMRRRVADQAQAQDRTRRSPAEQLQHNVGDQLQVQVQDRDRDRTRRNPAEQFRHKGPVSPRRLGRTLWEAELMPRSLKVLEIEQGSSNLAFQAQDWRSPRGMSYSPWLAPAAALPRFPSAPPAPSTPSPSPRATSVDTVGGDTTTASTSPSNSPRQTKPSPQTQGMVTPYRTPNSPRQDTPKSSSGSSRATTRSWSGCPGPVRASHRLRLRAVASSSPSEKGSVEADLQETNNIYQPPHKLRSSTEIGANNNESNSESNNERSSCSIHGSDDSNDCGNIGNSSNNLNNFEDGKSSAHSSASNISLGSFNSGISNSTTHTTRNNATTTVSNSNSSTTVKKANCSSNNDSSNCSHGNSSCFISNNNSSNNSNNSNNNNNNNNNSNISNQKNQLHSKIVFERMTMQVTPRALAAHFAQSIDSQDLHSQQQRIRGRLWKAWE